MTGRGGNASLPLLKWPPLTLLWEAPYFYTLMKVQAPHLTFAGVVGAAEGGAGWGCPQLFPGCWPE